MSTTYPAKGHNDDLDLIAEKATAYLHRGLDPKEDNGLILEYGEALQAAGLQDYAPWILHLWFLTREHREIGNKAGAKATIERVMGSFSDEIQGKIGYILLEIDRRDEAASAEADRHDC